MNTWQAQYDFWSSFGLPAYNEFTSIDEELVNEQDKFPYLTYEAFSGVYDQVRAVNVSLWYRSATWEDISLKADQIGTAIGEGVTLPVDSGMMWIHKSNTTPFAQPVDTGYADKQIKRINLLVEIECLKS